MNPNIGELEEQYKPEFEGILPHETAGDLPAHIAAAILLPMQRTENGSGVKY